MVHSLRAEPFDLGLLGTWPKIEGPLSADGAAMVLMAPLVRWQTSQNTNLKYILKKMDFYLISEIDADILLISLFFEVCQPTTLYQPPY